MELKKNESKDLESKRPLFLNIGLAITLTLTIVAFNWKSEIGGLDLSAPEDHFEPVYEMPITKIPEPLPPKPKIKKPSPVVNNHPPILIIDELAKSVKDDTPIDMDLDLDIPIDLGDGPPVETVEEPVIFVEEMPSFPGGEKAFYKYVSENLTYPRMARNLHITGRVYVQFVIDKDGTVTDVIAVRGVGEGLDEVAVEVLKNSPKWNPGKQRGREVRVRMILPITFRLD
ncbi:MAG: energy transducer TonB [Marinoscillum sp.]